MENTLHSYLARKKTRDLVNIACRLGIVNDDAERSPEEWAEAIEQKIGEHAYDVKECIGIQGVRWLNRQLTSENLREDVYRILKNECSPLQHSYLSGLCDLGLARRQSSSFLVLKMAKKLLKCTREESRQLENAGVAAETMCRFLSLYGVVPMSFAVRKVADGEPSDQRIRDAILSLYLHRWGLEGLMCIRDEYWLIYPDMHQREKIIPQLLRERPEKPVRKEFTAEEMARIYAGVYGDPVLHEKLCGILSGPDSAAVLGLFYLEQQLSRKHAAEIVMEMMPEKERALGRILLRKYMDTLPRWQYFGFSEAERRPGKTEQARQFSGEKCGPVQ